jgi:protein subunit release factor B
MTTSVNNHHQIIPSPSSPFSFVLSPPSSTSSNNNYYKSPTTSLHATKTRSYTTEEDAVGGIDEIPGIANQMPHNSYTLNFATSQGKGGQNVNKVNTKAMLRFPLDGQGSWLPSEVRVRMIVRNKTFVNKENEIVLSCQASRSQAANKKEVISKLTDMLDDAGIPDTIRAMRSANYVSEGTKVTMKKNKKITSDKKKSRGKVGKNDW